MHEKIKEETRQILDAWLGSCTRNRKIARNTIAMGIVVLDHLLRSCPAARDDIISKGGEVSGARSGLGKVLEFHHISGAYLKEITTRQSHQDGQKLLDQLEWGRKLAILPERERKALLHALIGNLRQQTDEWFKRQNLNSMLIDGKRPPHGYILSLKMPRGVPAAL